MDHVFQRLQYQQNAELKIYLASHAKPSWLHTDSGGNFSARFPFMKKEIVDN
jgi:hypothetical protein